MNRSLQEIARVLRSKNSGPFELTLDIMFDSEENYRLVKNSGVITRELICKLYSIEDNAITCMEYYDPALALKITMNRKNVSGGIGDRDVYGAQQHGPLLNIRIPI